MKRIPAWLTYTVLRLLFVAVPLVVLLLVLPAEYWIFSAAAAVIVGLCLSFLFLRRPRQAIADQLAAARRRERTEAKPTVDDEVEDAAVDAAQQRVQGAGE